MKEGWPADSLVSCRCTGKERVQAISTAHVQQPPISPHSYNWWRWGGVWVLVVHPAATGLPPAHMQPVWGNQDTLYSQQPQITLGTLPPHSPAVTEPTRMRITTIELSHEEYAILAKGLSFIPKPKRLDILELLSDVNNFIRKIRNRFNASTRSKSNKSPFYWNRPYKYLPMDNNKLENILENLLLNSTYLQTKKDNLSYRER